MGFSTKKGRGKDERSKPTATPRAWPPSWPPALPQPAAPVPDGALRCSHSTVAAHADLISPITLTSPFLGGPRCANSTSWFGECVNVTLADSFEQSRDD
jgi:hypothetical protein